MKFLIPLLFITSTLMAQNPCEDFLPLFGRTDKSQQLVSLRKECGPFEESISNDGSTKTWTCKERGIEITFSDDDTNPEFVVTAIELTVSTSKGGYDSKLPFGFEKDMTYKMAKNHIKASKDLTYDRSDLGIDRSYTYYTGPINDASEGKRIRVYLAQYRGRNISTLRMNLR